MLFLRRWTESSRWLQACLYIGKCVLPVAFTSVAGYAGPPLPYRPLQKSRYYYPRFRVGSVSAWPTCAMGCYEPRPVWTSRTTTTSVAKTHSISGCNVSQPTRSRGLAIALSLFLSVSLSHCPSPTKPPSVTPTSPLRSPNHFPIPPRTLPPSRSAPPPPIGPRPVSFPLPLPSTMLLSSYFLRSQCSSPAT